MHRKSGRQFIGRHSIKGKTDKHKRKLKYRCSGKGKFQEQRTVQNRAKRAHAIIIRIPLTRKPER